MRTTVIYSLITTALLGLIQQGGTAHAYQAERPGSRQAPAKATSNDDNSSLQGQIITLESLIEEAVGRNPGIQAMEQQWETAKIRIPQAGAWMDPKLNITVMNFPISEFSFSVEPMTQKQISLMQTIPFPGITPLKEQIANEETEIAGYSASDTRNNVVKDVSLAYYDIFLIDKSIEITLKNKQVFQDFITIALKKYETGKGLQQDVLKAQVEMSKLDDKLITFRKRRNAVVSRLNAMLNRPTSEKIGAIEDVRYEPLKLDVLTLQDAAVASRPMLHAMQTQIQRNNSAFDLATKQYWPSFRVGIAYGQRGRRRDFFTAQFSVDIPVWRNRKQDKKIEETQSTIAASEKMYENTKNTILGQIAVLVSSLEETDERIGLIKDVIIPQATQSLNSAIYSYQVNKVDFLTLLNNQITLFNFELDYYRLLTSYKKDVSTLEFVVGQPLK